MKKGRFEKLNISEVCSYECWKTLDVLYQQVTGFFPHPPPLHDYLEASDSSKVLDKMIRLHKRATGSNWQHPKVDNFDQYMDAFNKKWK